MNVYQNYMMNTGVETIHVFEINRNIYNEALIEEPVDTTSIDWDNLESIIPSGRNEDETITYDQSLEYFKGADLSKYNEKIVTTIRKSSNIFACFTHLPKSKLKERHIDDYNLLFLIAKCPYEKDNRMHVAMLRTVYDSLVSNEDLRFSWENIGFQSNLPWTDLRGVGMLGVLQLLYLCTSYPILTKNLYQLSIDKLNPFPFAAVSLNITRIVLNVLRSERLNRDVNKEGVFICSNKLYAAIYYRFGEIWTSGRKTISDIGKIFKDMEQSSLSRRARGKIMRKFKLKSNEEILSTTIVSDFGNSLS